jgi:predicted transcriptional regulator/transcriptional regulator with XRE-family HTH domain
MVDDRALYLGPRLKRLRRELGLTQQAMAEDLEISPSYVALLERNQRPMTAPLLLRLARTYKLDIEDLSLGRGDDYAPRVAEALRDPIFADIDLPALEVADLATNFPGISEALLRLHGAYLREQQALAEQRVPGAEAVADPVADVRRFLAGRRNHFAELETRAEAVAADLDAAGGAEAFLRKRGLRVRFLPPEVLVDTIRRYDRHNEQLLIDDTLDAAGRAWQLAVHIAYTVLRSDIARIVRAETFASQTAATLVRRALAGYAAAALLMPYDKFVRAAESRRYDVEALARLFGVSFEQAAHRLTTLARPGREGVPFFFLRLDRAGNVSKRFDGAGFPFAAHGGSCPLWTVHATFGTPGVVVTQWLELPDGQRFFSIARMVTAGGGGEGRPRVDRAVALVCAAEHVPQLIHARGADPRKVAATPIGVTCRLCHRAACPARATPPIGREILPDDYRRALEPFTLGES